MKVHFFDKTKKSILNFIFSKSLMEKPEEPVQEPVEKERTGDSPPDVPEGFDEWMKMAEQSDSAPFHQGDLPPENNQFGSYYVPRILGPEDKPLPDMPWDNTGPAEEAKPAIIALIHLLRRSGLMVLYFERLPKKDALSGYYSLVFDLRVTAWYQISDALRHLNKGDVMEMAAHEWTLLVRDKAWHNIYEDPLKREQYWRLKREEEENFRKTMGKKANLKIRVGALEMRAAHENRIFHESDNQRKAIQVLLMLHTKYKFNSEMMEHLRENVAHHERDMLAERRRNVELALKVHKLEQDLEYLQKKLFSHLVVHNTDLTAPVKDL